MKQRVKLPIRAIDYTKEAFIKMQLNDHLHLVLFMPLSSPIASELQGFYVSFLRLEGDLAILLLYLCEWKSA